MSKLCLIMVGLPARGKTTLSRRIKQGLESDGYSVEIFNNGELRRQLLGPESSEPVFYSPENEKGREAREDLCRQNLAKARQWLANQGDVAIIDATNGSRERRKMIVREMENYPILFIECLNEDKMLLEVGIRRKAQLPEYANVSEDAAVASFTERLGYYESIYEPLEVGHEEFWIRVDSMANRILDEQPNESLPYYPAIREILVCPWVSCLYLVRHGQTEYNLQGRLGGNPPLTAKGQEQARRLAEKMANERIDWLFTSTRLRSHQTAAPILANRQNVHTMALKELDEIWAGDCEELTYDDIREKMPHITAERNANKYSYAYPNGESYAILRNRVQRGVRRALFLAGDRPLMIVGHQAINRVALSLFLQHRSEDIPYIHVPQNQFYRLQINGQRRIFERIPY